PGARTVRLEQNYRSTATILKAANAVIAHNQGRLGKNLWTEDAAGEPLALYAAFNEYDEARFVAEQIRQWLAQGGRRADAAILYRSNAQSRVFEETLIGSAIPYRVYGGLRFFERQEVKDALAYLRLIRSRDDDASFERVANTPTRGIGERTLEAVRDLARREKISLWQAALRVVAEKQLPARAGNALSGFLALIGALDRDTAAKPLGERVDHVIHHSGLVEMYRKEKGDKGEMRVENLLELVNAAQAFEYLPEDVDPGSADLDPLAAFLVHAALEAGEGQGGQAQDGVQLMTLHSAKGLEFPLVFLAGLEEGLFPHSRSLDEPGRLEEERRLAYVGITRARQRLFLSYAETRRVHGNDMLCRPSRFVGEIPPELLREVRTRFTLARPVYTAPKPAAPAPDGLHPGRRVRHPTFGEGTVVAVEGSGDHARVQVSFARGGAKWLVVAYAKLELL
ncbi:MAG: ATP-binding domain-containing protein, partial [Pseudomonadota bacterium]|nr:ATP-binding domain-containing protein [Pseudomonadota bacterium]